MPESKLVSKAAISIENCVPVNCDTCGHRKDNPICKHDFTLQEIAKIKRDLTINQGQIIYNSGDMVTGLYSVRSGLVKLESYSDNGSAHTVQIIGAGSAFGYRHLFKNTPSNSTAIALAKTELCLLPKDLLLPIVSQKNEILISLVEKLTEGVETVEKKWLHQMDMGAVERVAEALVFLCEQFPTAKWTRKDIAQWAGTTPETVIRTLAQFEKEGLIDQSEGRSIEILDKNQLVEKYIP